MIQFNVLKPLSHIAKRINEKLHNNKQLKGRYYWMGLGAFASKTVATVFNIEQNLNFQNEFEYVAHKLDMTVDELQKLFEGENKTFKDYRNKRHIIDLGGKVLTMLKLEKRLIR